jgi:hypothetical protein
MPSQNKRLFLAWLFLTAITAMYLWIDHAATKDGIPTASVAVTVAGICIALLKMRIIMRQFMEVRHAPAMLRRLADLCIVVIAAALFASYFIGRATAPGL